jgi:hypothetical protein
VNDIEPAFCDRVCTLLEAQRAAIARYGHLLDGQRAALRAEDLELLAELAAQAADLLGDLEAASRHLVRVTGHLSGRDGGRSRTVRELIAVVSLELQQELARVRQFTEAVQHRKGALVRAIGELEGGSHPRPGNSFRPLPPGPNFLDRSG